MKSKTPTLDALEKREAEQRRNFTRPVIVLDFEMRPWHWILIGVLLSPLLALGALYVARWFFLTTSADLPPILPL